MLQEPRKKTFGEILPDCVIELVSDKLSQTNLNLLVWDGTNARILHRYQPKPLIEWDYHTKVFVPPDIDPTILQAIRFPTNALPYSSECELFLEVCNVIEQYTYLPEKLGRLLAYCVFASWFSDCTSISTCVSIIGPETRQGWQLFRLLSCLYRRALPLSDVSLSGFFSLPAELFPALFLEQRELSPQSEKVLHASNGRDTFIPWRGRLVSLNCSKVIRSEEPLSNFTLRAGAIEIPVDPGCWSLPMLDRHTQQEIADRFQPKLLMYRLRNIERIRDAVVDFPDFERPVRELACCLAACVPDMPEIQMEMTSLLEERNLDVQADIEVDPKLILLRAMLSFCHQANKKLVRVAEVASAVNAILEQEGEMFELSPKAVGLKLAPLGLKTKRIDAKSRGMLLTDSTRQLIHKLAWDCGVSETRDVQHCGDCKHFAQLAEEATQPYCPGKGIIPPSSQPGEAPVQPPHQPNISRAPYSDQGECTGMRGLIENQNDQDICDKLERENEL